MKLNKLGKILVVLSILIIILFISIGFLSYNLTIQIKRNEFLRSWLATDTAKIKDLYEQINELEK